MRLLGLRSMVVRVNLEIGPCERSLSDQDDPIVKSIMYGHAESESVIRLNIPPQFVEILRFVGLDLGLLGLD